MKTWRDSAAAWLDALWYGRTIWHWPLVPSAWLFSALVWIRRQAYRYGWLASVDVGVPVIVVGNLTVGGTGKTPLVIWIVTELLQRGYRVGVICRGYGGKAESWPQPVAAFSDAAQVGDEATLLAKRLGCRVVAGPDRVAAARMLLQPGPLDVIVSDDGLQHYRLRRDVEIAVVDGDRGLGNGWCLPAGPLREPPARLRDVDAIVVNGGDFGHAGVVRATLRPGAVVELESGTEKRLADFAGQRVHAIAAIGHPQRFFDSLTDHGIAVEPHPLADHAEITAAHLDYRDGLPVLLTEKDAVKCERIGVGNVWRVVANLEFAAGNGERLLRTIVRQLDRVNS